MAFNLSLALILSAAWLNAAETFILSYRSQIKDAVVISESYLISHTMQAIHADKGNTLHLYAKEKSDIDTLLHNNKERVIDFLMHEKVHTRSHQDVLDAKSRSLITITIPPTYVTVDFNDDYAIITRLITE